MEPKSKKKRLKCDAWKQCRFKSVFNAVFFAWASENGAKIQCFSHLYRRRRFCKSDCFPMGKLLFFSFRAFKNLIKIDAKTISKKNQKNASKIECWPPCWPPKSFEIPPKSDAERSLFRDAMQIASKSSQVNGGHSLLGIQMATHMIRSSPSIHWSAPRRPNHPSKSCNLHISSNAMPLEAPKSTKIEVQGLQNPSKKQL